MNVILDLIGLLSITLLGTAFSVMSMSPPQYDIARGAAIGACISAVLSFLLWLSITDENISIKIIIGVIAGIISLGGLPIGLNWIGGIQNRNTQAEQKAIQPKNAGVLEADAKLLFSTSSNRGAISSIEIGDSGTVFVWVGTEGTPMFNFYGSEIIVESINNAIKVTTQIKDGDGNLVAELIRNEWKVAPPPKTWDRNYSNDSLEVIDPNGNVVLQVKALIDRIQLQGEWRGDNNHGVRLVDPHTTPKTGANIISFTPLFPDGGENYPRIRRMFAYPSELHLGEVVQ